MSVRDRSWVEHRSYMCIRHVVCDVGSTIIGTQGEIAILLEMDNKGTVD